MRSEGSIVLVGFSDISQIDEVTSASNKDSLPESAMRRLRELWSSDFDRDFTQETA